MAVLCGLLAAGVAQAAGTDASRSYVILVNGGLDKKSNHLRFWGDMSLAYSTFRHDFGIPRENIKVLWATGDPSSDLCKAGKGVCSTCRNAEIPLNPFDLDRDGVGDIGGPASLAAVEAAFAELGQRLKEGDQLFVYFSDHGTKYGYEAYAETAIDQIAGLNFWNGEVLTDWMLAGWTRNLPCPVVFALSSCYSGGLIADLLDSSGIRFVATASEYSSSHAGLATPHFDEWVYDFFSALRGYYPVSSANVRERGRAAEADADGDGSVSFREAARFAYRHRSKADYPQYAESWRGCGGRLFPVATMDAEELAAFAEAHQAERCGFQGFRRACALTFANGAYSPEADGSDEFPGERLTVIAPPSVTTKGVTKAFVGWKTKPVGADLGPTFDRTSLETEFRMPASALTLTPDYATVDDRCAVCLRAVANRTDRDCSADSRWSPDGSVWYRSGDTALLKPGSHSLRWKSVSSAWKAPSAKTKVKLESGESYDNSDAPAVFTYAPLVDAGVQVLKNDRWGAFAGCGKVHITPSSSGRIAPGSKTTLTATTANGFVFAGWTCGELEISDPLAKKISFQMPGDDLPVIARFVTRAHDAASIGLSFAGGAVATGTGVLFETNVLCGVRVAWPVVAQADSKTTITARGLPSGLSLKKTDDGYMISGAPTSASKLPKNATVRTPSKVTLTVTTAGSSTRAFTLMLTVFPLPSWAQGTFTGVAAFDDKASGVGVSTLTVSSAGKISGKFAAGGTNWTYSATGYASFEDAEDEADRRFVIEGTAKSGKKSGALSLSVAPGAVEGVEDWLGRSTAAGLAAGSLIEMRRGVWKDKVPGLYLPVGTLDLASQGLVGLSAKVQSSGTVKFSGSLAGRKVSVSTTAYPEQDGTISADLVLPADKKNAGQFYSVRLNP